jgi:WhiB family redox-sensing transcriptional regulator
MAEVTSTTFTNSQEDRPPKLTPIEASFLLERGPYIGRLRAKERLLDIVLALTVDNEVGAVMDLRQSDRIKEDIVRLESELVQFEATFDWDADNTLESSELGDVESKAQSAVIIPVDFLKRKETAVCSETDPEVFFPEKGGSTRMGKAICEKSCDLTDECLAYALETKERFGIWGGASERERRKLLKKQVSS